MRYNTLKSKAHCRFYLIYHVVFVTKFRRKYFTKDMLQYLCHILPKIASKYSLVIPEISGEPEHIHFLLETTPQDNLGNVISILKSVSASMLLNKFGSFYYGKHKRTLWSSGYFVTTCDSAPLSIIKQYINNHNI